MVGASRLGYYAWGPAAVNSFAIAFPAASPPSARARAIGRGGLGAVEDGGRLPRGACNAIGITSPLSFQTLRVRARASGP